MHDDLAFRATYLIARALESQGNVDDAILELEPLLKGDGAAIPRAGAGAIPAARIPRAAAAGDPTDQGSDRPEPVLPGVRRPLAGHRRG